MGRQATRFETFVSFPFLVTSLFRKLNRVRGRGGQGDGISKLVGAHVADRARPTWDSTRVWDDMVLPRTVQLGIIQKEQLATSSSRDEGSMG